MKHPLVVNCKTDEYDEYVGRPSEFGNPFIIGVHGTRSEVVLWHREWIDGLRPGPNGEIPPTRERIRAVLRGKRIGCWCRENEECHAEYLAFVANPRRGGLFNR